MKIESTLKNLKYQAEFDSRCFIATAVYGSSEASEVIELKKYRDSVLMKNSACSLFVKFYYAISPSISRILEKSEPFKRISKVILDKIVNVLRNKY
ncbi:MAG: CFI-box-CTERM domain-containing protein [Methanobacterium sp.]